MTVRSTHESTLVSSGGVGKTRSTHESVLISCGKPGTTRSTHESVLISVTAPTVAITYPLTPPALAGLGPQDLTLQMVNVVGESESPFTLGQQEQQWQGQQFRLEANLPPMTRAQAEPWIAFLGAMFGKVGTFLMGDYSARSPQGVATGTPLVSGSSNVNGINQLFTKGWTAGVTGILKAGDYIQVAAPGGPQRLHKNLLDANADGSGLATLQIFPNIRESLVDGATITVVNTVGTFRLQEDTVDWKIDRNRMYSLAFKAKEAI